MRRYNRYTRVLRFLGFVSLHPFSIHTSKALVFHWLTFDVFAAKGDLVAPPPPVNSSPAFTLVQQALNVYGNFARHLMLLYVCINPCLEEQLIHLSAAAHLAFQLYCHNLVGTHFMPVQSYLDIILMIKNVFFCVAKAKVDNPTSNLYLISLGTNHLETFCGLILSRQYAFIFSFMPTFFFLVYFTLSHVTLLSHGSHVQSHNGSPDL